MTLNLYGQSLPRKSNHLPPVKPFSDEWVLLQFLKKWTVDDIRKAIDKDVDLEELVLGHKAEVSQINFLISKYDPEPWTVGETLHWFSERRPDLYVGFVEREAGIQWLIKHWSKRMRIKKILT